MNRLEGKVALVTGARRGIGEGIAKQMTAEGAIVIAADIEPGSVSDLNDVLLDVTREDEWIALAENVRHRFGRLDVLVNNAGIVLHKPALETSLEEWRRVMAVNLDGVFLGCKIMQPLLAEAGRSRPAGGSIVNVSSTMGIGAMPDQIAYGSSKAGVRHLTKLLAVEWANPGQNIRVNSVHPGTTRTEMLDKVALRWAQENTENGSLESGLRALASMNPLQRLARIEDIAHAVTYLASDEAAYVTGTELVVDGGLLAR